VHIVGVDNGSISGSYSVKGKGEGVMCEKFHLKASPPIQIFRGT
jgi:hypothetical protein